MQKFTPLIIAAAALAACTDGAMSDRQEREMEELKVWLRQVKGDDPETARKLLRVCATEGSLLTAAGKLAISRCMRRSYDEGVRA